MFWSIDQILVKITRVGDGLGDSAGGAHGDGFDGPGLAAAVSAVAGTVPGRDLGPGQGLELGVEGRLVAFDGEGVVGFLVLDEVAELVVFLAGPLSLSLTGALIPFDGGFTAH